MQPNVETDTGLHNESLAPIEKDKQTWGLVRDFHYLGNLLASLIGQFLWRIGRIPANWAKPESAAFST